MEKCINCQYYDRRNARPSDGRAPLMWGQCRRHSPHLNPVTSKKSYQVEGVWPLVRDDDWCGEWRAPTRSSITRARFAPRGIDMPAAPQSASAAPTAASSEEPTTIAAD